MAAFDWKSVVGALAPGIGMAFGGPLGGMAGKLVAAAVTGNEDSSPKEVEAVFEKGLTPEAIVALKTADLQFAARMKELDIDLAKVNADVERSYITDTNDARKAHAGNKDVFRLGIAILSIFAVIMSGVMFASFQVLTGGITIKDVGVVAMVSGLIGTVVGYVASNAQQVVNYFFGSSKGSSDKTDSMTSAISKLGAK